MQNPVILKIGGSLLSKSDELLFDFAYFAEFKKMLTKMSAEGHKFILCVGGGFITRKYQRMLQANGEQDTPDVHRVGVAATNLNAEVVHGLLDNLALPNVLRYADFDSFLASQNQRIAFGERSVLVVSGSQPGKSNDWNALQFALNLNIKRVIDIKNIDGVYTADPAKDPAARKVAKLNWDEYMDIIGNPTEHVPGANYPVDPIAAKQSKQAGIEFVIVGGTDFSNLETAITGGEFSGSVISG